MSTLWTGTMSRAELMRRVGRLEQVGGVRLVELGDGDGRGVRVLEFRTGAGFTFDVLIDRTFDVWRCELNGIPLAWTSPVGVRGPWYYEPAGLGWSRTFAGGLVVTCGLDHAQGPGEDTAAQYNQPHFLTTQAFGIHGRVGGLPARLVGYGERWDGDECVLWAEGEVLQGAVFEEHLLLRRRIEAPLGGASLRILDTVENVGHAPTPHMFIYHCNIGWPIVDDGAEIVVPARSWSSTYPAAVPEYRRLTAPQPGFTEACYEHDMAADADGWVECGVVNPALELGVVQRYRLAQMPHHQAWRMMGEDTYAVALEPQTNRDAGKWDARERGELVILEPGASRSYELVMAPIQGADQIESLRARAARAAGS